MCIRDSINTIPTYLLDIPIQYNTSIDIMIEAKKKEQAIFQLYEKYPFLSQKPMMKEKPGFGWATNAMNCECGC